MAKKFQVGVVIYTYDRVDDARINIELIRAWQPKTFSVAAICHAYNGKKGWYKKTSEDYFLTRKNLGHVAGAADLIDTGVMELLRKEKRLDYIVVFAADTWLVRPDYLEKVLAAMRKKSAWIGAARWLGHTKDVWLSGLATDFFVIDAHAARKLKFMPLDQASFAAKYQELFDYWAMPIIIENMLAMRLLQAIERLSVTKNRHFARLEAEDRCFFMEQRWPVHRQDEEQTRIMHWPKIHLFTDHDPKYKQHVLHGYTKLAAGPFTRKLLEATNLAYYNTNSGR